jgi:hypothetical protein
MTEEQRKDFEEAAEKYAFDSAARTVAKFAFLAGCDFAITHAVPKWIDVKERLPGKEFEYYMVWNTANQEGSEREIQAFINRFTSRVTHWQPLPSPPSSKGN